MRIGSLFSGFGGLDMAVAGHYGASVAWHVEFDKHPSKVLAHHYPDIPNFGDVTTVDWSAVEPVDIITGGFPCQDVSHAGLRRGVHQGTRSGLWFEMARAIDALRPWKVVIENVAGLLSASAAGDVEPCPWCLGDSPDGHMRALGAVLADLAEMGFDARWGSVRAADAGAPHGQLRVFIVATRDTAGSDAGLRRQATPPRATGGADNAAGDSACRGPRERGSRPRELGRQQSECASSEIATDGLTLLPTPVTNDMGAGKTVEAWDEWTASMQAKHGNGNGHGKSLAIEAQRHTDFGPYTAAIRRWEAVIGRPAPSPTEPGSNGRPRLSPRFVEFMMGVPAGWVTDVDIPRSAQLKALGNGVVPQQALLALALLDGAP